MVNECRRVHTEPVVSIAGILGWENAQCTNTITHSHLTPVRPHMQAFHQSQEAHAESAHDLSGILPHVALDPL